MTHRPPVQLRIAQALHLAPMTTSELARALALPRPTAHRALADLGALGKVRPHGSAPRMPRRGGLRALRWELVRRGGLPTRASFP